MTDRQTEVFEAMYRTHYRTVQTYVRHHSPPGADPADIMSRTFETAWRRLDEIPPDAVVGWLIGTARNCMRNAVRADRRFRSRFDDYREAQTRWSDDLYQHDVPIEIADQLAGALDDLQPADREVLWLAIWQGLSGADLGAALEISSGTAAVRLTRARQRLRDAFERRGTPS